MLPQEIIRSKRDGGRLDAAAIGHFVRGLVDGSFSDGQAAALAMAIVLRGMDTDETVALTTAMRDSGTVLRWDDAGLAGPVLDKHSTGGVGDKLSLMLAPIVAACGGVVPMISGRGLGHTGGTLDKLQALPGYRIDVDRATLLTTLRSAGCAIVGASDDLAPADRRLYAIRDLTATVESVPLITASILSKKLSAGLQALVLDVKFGSGAFMATAAQAQQLARCLIDTARGAGLPARALITDMNQVLGRTAGNALEVREALDLLMGRDTASDAPGHAAAGTRQRDLTLALSAELLHLGGVAPTLLEARRRAQAALSSGAAAERFARMVAALGGPTDVLRDAQLPRAPLRQPVPAPRSGYVALPDVRALGLVVVALGGGRTRPGAAIDPRVGLSAVLPPGAPISIGQPLAVVHAADAGSARAAGQAVLAAMPIADEAPAVTAVVLQTLRG